MKCPMSRAAVLLLSLALAAPAAAQSAVPAVALVQPPPPPSKQKSHTTARLLSVGGTFAGWGLMLGGFWGENVALFYGGQAVSGIGPSTAHLFYTGETTHGLVTSAIRVGALAAADIGAGLIIGCIPNEAIGGGNSNQDPDCGTGASVMLLSGLSVAAALGLYDWWDSGRSADRYNAKHGVSMTFAPITITGLDATAHGLALLGQF